MSCCQGCLELCFPCLAKCKRNDEDSKWAHVHYQAITTPGPKAPLTKTTSLEIIEVPDILPLEKAFNFPQKQAELPRHPQMFMRSSSAPDTRLVVTEQPRAQPSSPSAAYIGHRKFSTLPATSSAESEHVVRGRALSLPQNSFVRKTKGKTRSRSQTWTLKKLQLKKSASLDVDPASEKRGSMSLPEMSKGKSLLKRRRTVETDMVMGTAYSFWIPGLPVLEEESLTKDSKRPLLQFSLQYDVQRCTLTVHLHHACNLPAKDRRTRTSDPFVVLYMMPNKEVLYESKVVSQTLDPVFDESFEFDKLTADDIRRQSLVFRLYDHDRFSKNDTIGGVVLPLMDADLFGVVMRMEVDEDPKFFNQVRVVVVPDLE